VHDLNHPLLFYALIKNKDDAITTIKSVYGVTRNWQGDPCAPVDYLWDGLNCSYSKKESPRITTL